MPVFLRISLAAIVPGMAASDLFRVNLCQAASGIMGIADRKWPIAAFLEAIQRSLLVLLAALRQVLPPLSLSWQSLPPRGRVVSICSDKRIVKQGNSGKCDGMSA